MPLYTPSGAAGDLPTDYIDTTPTAPTTGVRQFSRFRARRILAWIGPSGQDTRIQPSLFSNRTHLWMAVNNTTTGNGWGHAVTVASGGGTTATAVANASTNFYTSMVRMRVATTTTAGTFAEVRNNTAQWFLSNTANMGGFHFVARFGLNVTATVQRVFVGLTASTAAMTNVAPTTLVNSLGFGVDSGNTTFRFYNNAAGTGTATDLGANFPSGTAATYFYEATIFAPAGNAGTVYYSLQRLNDGLVTNGTVTTNLPAVATMLTWHAFQTNNTSATATSLDLQSVYLETDN
jgi:hypothetical protein